MKIRNGFVSNSSSSSFILSTRDVNSIKKSAEKYQRKFNKILEKINIQDKKCIQQYLLSEKEKEKLIKKQFKWNKEALEKQIKILKDMEEYLEELNGIEIDSLFDLMYSKDREHLFFDNSIFKLYYPFSARVYYLAQKLEKINKKIYKETFDWENYIKYKKKYEPDFKIKNIKRIKYNDIIWAKFYDIKWFLYYLKDEYHLSKFEEKQIKDILNQIEFEMILTYEKYIKKLKSEIFRNLNKGIKYYKVEFEDGGGCGIWAPWIENGLLQIPFILKINNH